EVGDYKIGVVYLNVQGAVSNDNPGEPTTDKCGDHTNREQHGRIELQVSFPYRRYPVESFYRRWNGDQKGGKGKYRSQERVHSGNEHVVSPNDGREEGDGKQGGYHGTIAENRFSGMYGEDFRYDSHGRKNYNIYLGVTQEPEKVFKEHGISALMAQHLSLDIEIGSASCRERV